MARIYIPKETPLVRALRGFGAPGKKPLANYAIAYSNPITRGLRSLIIEGPGGGVFGKPLTLTRFGTITPIVNGNVGTGVDFGNTDNDYDSITATSDLYLNSGTKRTLFTHGFAGRDSGQQCLWSQYTNTSLQLQIRINSTGAGTPNTINSFMYLGNTTPVFVAVHTANIIPSSGAVFAHASAFDVSAKQCTSKLQLGGALYSVTNTGTGAITQTNTTNLQTRNDLIDSDAYDGQLFIRGIWDRALSDAELESLVRDPYQVLQPANQSPLLIGTAAAGGVDALTPTDIESASEVSSPAVGQEHALTATDIESVAEVSSPTIGQIHALAATDAESASEVSSPALAESAADHNLIADDLQSLSEVSSPTVGQVHVLTAADIVSQSEISAPALGGEHALTATDIESVSEVSSPTLVDLGTITNAQIWAKLCEVHKILGLDDTAPMTVTPTSRVAGTISQTISGDGVSSTTVTRDP